MNNSIRFYTSKILLFAIILNGLAVGATILVVAFYQDSLIAIPNQLSYGNIATVALLIFLLIAIPKFGFPYIRKLFTLITIPFIFRYFRIKKAFKTTSIFSLDELVIATRGRCGNRQKIKGELDTLLAEGIIKGLKINSDGTFTFHHKGPTNSSLSDSDTKKVLLSVLIQELSENLSESDDS